MNYKLKAFTLSELLIVLILTVIIVGIAFSILRLVSYQIQAIRDVYEDQSEVLHFKQQLKFDIDSARRISHFVEDERLFIYKDQDTLEYNFSFGKFKRGNKNIPLEIISITAFNGGKETQAEDIDAIQFEIKVKDNKLIIFEGMNKAAVLKL